MDMREENTCAEKYCRHEKKSAPQLIVPENQRKEERRARVSGEKELALGNEPVINVGKQSIPIENRLIGIHSDVRQTDKKRPAYHKEGDCLEREKKMCGSRNQKERSEQPEEHRPLN